MNSRIILAKGIKLDRNYNNVVNYTENQMLSLLRSEGHFVKEKTDYSFIRGTGQIDTQFTYSEVLGANYIAFQNPDYSNKWFFAWIDEVQYRGNYNTRIIYTIDAWSTWFSDWTLKKCFVNRHHVNDDTIGLHTIPENLDVGEVIQESYEDFLMGVPDDPQILPDQDLYYFAVDGTYNPITHEDFKGTKKINGNLFGNWTFIFLTESVDLVDLYNFMLDLNDQNKIDSILNMYVLPKKLVDEIGVTKIEKGSLLGNYWLRYLNESATVITDSRTISKTTTFSGVTIKNNKCFCYPYNYLLVSNNIGNNIIYKYEDFSDSTIGIDIEMAVAIGASVRFVPKNYQGMPKNYNESLPLAKYPTCSWASDAYTNWLTQNAVNIATSIVTTGVSAYMGNYMGASAGIAGLIGQFYNASLMPSTTGGNNTGDVNFSAKCNKFSIHHMRAKTEYLKIIDDYFTRFGYAIKSLEMPNITGRTYWNYVEIGEQEEIGYGNVPHNFMDIINNACRKGVTIWHNHENIGNWDLTNTIVQQNT